MRVRRRGGKTTAVSLIPVAPGNRTRECLELARHANLLLPDKVSRNPDSVLLTLRQMRHLDAENAIAGDDAYWRAAWVIEGGLTVKSPEEIRLVLAALPSQGGESFEVAATGAPGRLAQTVERAWTALAAKIELRGDGPTAADRPEIADRDGGEAAMLLRQAKWFLDAHYPPQARQFANAAYALGNRGEDSLRLVTEAAIANLPLRLKWACPHGKADPRVIEPAVRLRYAAAIPDYLRVCQNARLYVHTLEDQLVSGVRGLVRTGGSRSDNFNEIVSQALRELHFFRRMMDDHMIGTAQPRELSGLDREIRQLTEAYLAKAKGHGSETRTLASLLFDSGRGFYRRHAPALLNRMLGRLVELAEGESKATCMSGHASK
jgi:hypothetical protein